MKDFFIPVLLGSVREERKSEAVAKWLTEFIESKGVKSELLDLRKISLPFFGEKKAQESLSSVKFFSSKLSSSHALVIVSPEYNHSFPGVLKNALDFMGKEVAYKPLGIAGVSSGSFGGARVIEQLRLVAIELKMIPIREALYFSNILQLFDERGELVEKSAWEKRANSFFSELSSMAEAMDFARKNFFNKKE